MKTIVILHGWGSDIKRWLPVKKLLANNGFKVYLPKLPGDRVRNTADYSTWVSHYTRNLKSFCLLGHSFGGQIAINFTAQYPNKVAKLILINSAGIRNKRNLKRLIFLPMAKIAKFFFSDKLKGVFYRFILETDYFKASPQMKQTLKLVVKEDQQTNLAKISRPTLIIWGGQDQLTPLSDGKLIHRLIKNSRLEVFPGARHGLPFTHSQAFVSFIKNFIS
jgi:pimeloyl-ACP methyl ester carboxylesterase